MFSTRLSLCESQSIMLRRPANIGAGISSAAGVETDWSFLAPKITSPSRFCARTEAEAGLVSAFCIASNSIIESGWRGRPLIVLKSHGIVKSTIAPFLPGREKIFVHRILTGFLCQCFGIGGRGRIYPQMPAENVSVFANLLTDFSIAQQCSKPFGEACA